MPEQQKSKGSSTALMVILIILVVVLIGAVVAGIGFIFLYKVGTSGEKPSLTTQIPASAGSSTGAASAPGTSVSPSAATVEPREGWQIYENSRYGYSLQAPSTFDKEESANGDGATFTTWDPPMTVRVWGEANSSNLTPQTAIDFDKEDFAKNEAENFQLVSEEDTTMGGLPAVKSVWSYSNPQTGDAIVTAKAYTVRGEAIIKLEFLIDYSAWSEYSTMFDEAVASFAFE